VAKRFDVGSRLSEPTYGLGSVIAVEDAYLRIDFDEHGVKKFLTSLATFASSKEPAPSRAGRRKRKTSVKSSKTKTTRASRGSAKSKTVKATKKAKASAPR
tara:strand:- start:347 stop:649 length:303 start_codon:yes stop_codon:yes gene_type:complete